MTDQPRQIAPLALLENTDKSTDAEYEQRVTKVYEMLVHGASRRQIMKYGKADKQAWGVGERQIDTYIAAATELIKVNATVDREYEYGRAIATLNTIITNAMNLQDYRVARDTRDQLNKLLGLYPPQKSESSYLFERRGVTVELSQQLLDACERAGIPAPIAIERFVQSINAQMDRMEQP